MRITHDNARGNRSDSSFERLANREERKSERQESRRANRSEQQTQREAERADRLADRGFICGTPSPSPQPSQPMPVEPDGGIGDGAGPIPFPPEATTLAIGEEDGGGGGFPVDPDDGKPIGGSPMPVEPDGGIGDGAGPIPFPPEVTTLAIGEEDGGSGGFPVDPDDGKPIGGVPIPVEPDGGIGDGAGPIPLPPVTGPTPVPERLQPPTPTGSYRLGENSVGANFLNFDGDGSASIIGGRGTALTFGTIRTGEDGSVFGENGSGSVNGTPITGGAGFKLSIAPNDAGYLLQLKANGETFDASAGPNGIIPTPVSPTGPTEPAGPPPSRGGGLLFLYSLGQNSLGASNVTLNTDGTGTITGRDLDLSLSGGGYNDVGDWVATAGSGTINGESVTLQQNADGNVFVASGEGGLATQVSAWIEGGRELDAAVLGVAQP